MQTTDTDTVTVSIVSTPSVAGQLLSAIEDLVSDPEINVTGLKSVDVSPSSHTVAPVNVPID
jgi:hypothetical protein